MSPRDRAAFSKTERYAQVMQACGLVNDHVTDCFRRQEIQGERPRA
jgi:3-methyladenine DNA glycosylase Tag